MNVQSVMETQGYLIPVRTDLLRWLLNRTFYAADEMKRMARPPWPVLSKTPIVRSCALRGGVGPLGCGIAHQLRFFKAVRLASIGTAARAVDGRFPPGITRNRP